MSFNFTVVLPPQHIIGMAGTQYSLNIDCSPTTHAVGYKVSIKQVQQALCNIEYQMTNPQVGLKARRPSKDR